MNLLRTTTQLLIAAVIFSACGNEQKKQDSTSKVAALMLRYANAQMEKDLCEDMGKNSVMYGNVHKFKQKVELITEKENNIDKIKDSLHSAVINLFGNDSALLLHKLRISDSLIAGINKETIENDIKIIEYIVITDFWNKQNLHQIPIDTMLPVLTQAANGSLVISNSSFMKNHPPRVIIENDKGSDNDDIIPFTNGMAVLDSKYLLNKKAIKGTIQLRGALGRILYLPFTKKLIKE